MSVDSLLKFLLLGVPLVGSLFVILVAVVRMLFDAKVLQLAKALDKILEASADLTSRQPCNDPKR